MFQGDLAPYCQAQRTSEENKTWKCGKSAIRLPELPIISFILVTSKTLLPSSAMDNGESSVKLRVSYICIASCMLITVSAYLYSRRNQNAACLSVPVSALSLGTVWEQESFEFSFPLSNVTNSDIFITEFRTGCRACTSVTPKTLTLGPGETRKISLMLDLLPTSNRWASLSHRDFSVTVVPCINGYPESTQAFKFTGRVRPVIGQNVQSFAFDYDIVKGTAPETLIVPIDVIADVNRLDVVAQSEFFEVKVGQMDVGMPCRLAVTPATHIPIGPFTEIIAIQPYGSVSDSLPPSKVFVHGNVVGGYYVSPSPLVLGCHRIGTSIHDHVVISSRSGAQFQITNVFVKSSRGLEATYSAGKLDSRHVVRFTQYIDCAGAKNEQVILRLENAEKVSEDVPLFVWHFGARNRGN